MTMISQNDPGLGNLLTEDVAAYLRKKGWKRSHHPNDRILVFEGPTADDAGEPISLVLPRRNDFEDFFLRLGEALDLLSVAEDRPVGRIVQEIRSLDRDILQERVIGPLGSAGNLSLELAAKLVLDLSTLVSLAASSEESPRPFIAKTTRTARRYLDQCRFGHTVGGSFGFTVEVPIPPMAQLTLDGIDEGPPFERRVMERIARGLGYVNQAVADGNVDILIENYERGFSANIYELFMETIRHTEGIELEYSVSWSPEWTVPQALSDFKPVRITRRACQYFETATRVLRQVREAVDTELNGQVVQLKADNPLSGGEEEADISERSITVLWGDGSRKLRVRIPLGMHDYRSACDAHKEGKTVVVKGRLEKVGKHWQLFSPRDFRVADE